MVNKAFEIFAFLTVVLGGGCVVLGFVYLIVRLYFIIFEAALLVAHLNKEFKEFLKEKYKLKVYSPKAEDCFKTDATK